MKLENITDRLIEKIDEKQNPSVIGLDPDIDKLPSSVIEKYSNKINNQNNNFKDALYVMENFTKDIIDSIADIVPAVKPNIAFYEMFGSEGLDIFDEIVNYAKEKDLIVIGDAKRADIGNTSKFYAKGLLGEVEAFEDKDNPRYKPDMLTINPYFGTDSVQPFLDECEKHDKGLFVLVKTSNKSSSEIQDLELKDGKKVYQKVGSLVETWGSPMIGEKGYSSIGAVVGATHPEEAKILREEMPHTFFLLPGYGAQGAKAEMLVNSFDKEGFGAIVNSSRGVLYAQQKDQYKNFFSEDQFVMASRAAALNMKKDIKDALRKAEKLPKNWS